MSRRFLAALCVTATAFLMAVHAAEPVGSAPPMAPKPAAPGDAVLEEARNEALLNQQKLLRQFGEFKEELSSWLSGLIAAPTLTTRIRRGAFAKRSRKPTTSTSSSRSLS